MQTKGIEFPCDFPIKIVGRNHPEFELAALSIVREHFPTLSETSIQMRRSKDDTYLSLTVTVYATNQSELDALYQKLSAHEHVLFVL